MRVGKMGVGQGGVGKPEVCLSLARNGAWKMTSKEGEHVYQPEGLFLQAFSKLEKLRVNQQLCDIVVRVAGKRFDAHKVVLVSCCPYFEAMFLSGMTESKQSEVDLQGVEPDAFDAILKLLYTGQIHITTENVQSILSAASIFQIEHLRIACADFLKKQLAPFNCLGIKAFAEAHGCSKLVEDALKHTISRFTEVAACDEFLMLNVDDVTELLSRDDLKVHSEEDVFDAAVRWVTYDVPERAQLMPKLLAQVRLPLLPPAVLADKVRPNRLIQSSIQCRDLLDEALISYHLLPERRSTIPPQKTKARKCTFNVGVIYAVGGLNSVGGSLSSVEKFDSSRGVWESSKPMRTLRSRVGVSVVEGKLFAFGGYDGASRLCTVECYNPKEDEWTVLSPMSTRRSALSIAVLSKDIYIIGGYDGTSSLCSVEVYNVPSDSWSTSTPMHTYRSAAGAATLNGQVYVIGGHDGHSIFNTVERFDPESRTWTMVTPMNSRRCRLGVTTAAGMLFSIGGYDGQSFLNSMECYDPSSNQWSTLAPMTCRRSRVGVVAIANQIFAIGGYDGLTNLNTVEVYSVDEEVWSTAAPMKCHQGGVGVAVIPLD